MEQDINQNEEKVDIVDEYIKKFEEHFKTESSKEINTNLLKDIFHNYICPETTNSIGDYGADILGENNGIKYAFQCKRFESKVGPKPIGEVLRGMNYYGCDKGVIIILRYMIGGM